MEVIFKLIILMAAEKRDKSESGNAVYVQPDTDR
jgi:hypothetical protein